MGATRVLNFGGEEVELTWDLEERTTIPSGKKVWTLKIKVCNRTARNLDIAVAENPWRAPNNGEKIEYDKDANGRLVPNSDRAYARRRAKDLQLRPGECKTVEFTYDIQPGMAYTDIFEKKPDGSLKDDWTWGTVQLLTPVQVSLVPTDQEQTFALAIPTPLQMFAADQHAGMVKAVIERIDVPVGFELAHAFPGVGIPFNLQPGDRGSQAAVILRHVDGLPQGARSTLIAWQRIVEPAFLSDQPARPCYIDLVNDTTGPRLRVSRVRVAASVMSFAMTAADRVSGVSRIECLVIHGDGTVCSVQPRTETSSEGSALREAALSVPLPKGTAPRIVLRATDLVGNTTVHTLPARRRAASAKKPRRSRN